MYLSILCTPDCNLDGYWPCAAGKRPPFHVSEVGEVVSRRSGWTAALVPRRRLLFCCLLQHADAVRVETHGRLVLLVAIVGVCWCGNGKFVCKQPCMRRWLNLDATWQDELACAQSTNDKCSCMQA
jgi:hypothetical protein